MEEACIVGVLDTTVATVEGVVPAASTLAGTVLGSLVVGALSASSIAGVLDSVDEVAGTLENC